MRKIILLSLLTAFFTSSFAQKDNDKKKVEGSGNVITRNVSVQSFDQLDISGVFSVQLTQGSKEEVRISASYGVDLYPGDVIGSGTVGTGCFLELNGTGKLNDPNYKEQWLQPNDVVEMEIDGLGKLSNTIIAEESDWSILAKKK